MRIVMGVEYDGTAYCGWQSQDGSRTVQDEVQKAISFVANESLQVVCAGRTDSGVHAFGQVIHFDTQALRSERSWILGCNSNLPADINICWAKQTTDSFHARFGAELRRYRYVILNRPMRSGVHRHRVCWHHQPLDEQRMSLAAQYFVGEHDFTSFRALACQAHQPVRHIYHLDITRHGEYIIIDIEANAFLHHMVRNITGTLIAIGEGQQEPQWVAKLLAAKDRSKAAATAPARGLYFMSVQYPESFGIPQPALPTCFP